MKSMYPSLLIFLCLFFGYPLVAQVAINTTGAAPDASAQLDMTANDKGLLIPRMELSERDNINMPAHSLLIYQTDDAAGYYYNAGTPGSPDWQPLGSTIFGGGDEKICIDSLPYEISEPGSYMLCKNLTGTPNQNGITITASNVSLNLNGFSLIGAGGVSGEGITVPDSVGQLRIANGHIMGWGDEGVKAQNATSSEYLDLQISNNQGDGLHVGANSILKKITSSGNGSDGIEAEKNSLVTWCNSCRNGGDGIDVALGSVVLGSVANANGFNGFKIGDGVTVKDCGASENNADGFFISSGANISSCSASLNIGHGFRCTNDTYLHHNVSDSNTKSGFYTAFSDCRIEDNQGTDNGRHGFEVAGFGGCLIIRNGASGNTLSAYQISVGHAIGKIISLIDVPTNTFPLANLRY